MIFEEGSIKSGEARNFEDHVINFFNKKGFDKKNIFSKTYAYYNCIQRFFIFWNCSIIVSLDTSLNIVLSTSTINLSFKNSSSIRPVGDSLLTFLLKTLSIEVEVIDKALQMLEVGKLMNTHYVF